MNLKYFTLADCNTVIIVKGERDASLQLLRDVTRIGLQPMDIRSCKMHSESIVVRSGSWTTPWPDQSDVKPETVNKIDWLLSKESQRLLRKKQNGVKYVATVRYRTQMFVCLNLRKPFYECTRKLRYFTFYQHISIYIHYSFRCRCLTLCIYPMIWYD